MYVYNMLCYVIYIHNMYRGTSIKINLYVNITINIFTNHISLSLSVSSQKGKIALKRLKKNNLALDYDYCKKEIKPII